MEKKNFFWNDFKKSYECMLWLVVCYKLKLYEEFFELLD